MSGLASQTPKDVLPEVEMTSVYFFISRTPCSRSPDAISLMRTHDDDDDGRDDPPHSNRGARYEMRRWGKTAHVVFSVIKAFIATKSLPNLA